MKTTIKAKIVIETDKYLDYHQEIATAKANSVLTLEKIREELASGHYLLEWINSTLSNEQEPTLIIRI